MSGYIKKYGVPGVRWTKIEFPTRQKDHRHNQIFSKKLLMVSHTFSVYFTLTETGHLYKCTCVYVFSALALTYQG